ncbi:ABC transporter permease [Roseomonas indoligenes]|uniref:ABC transporter permease n=1 Tax=Roseomonas indoligenes TaxID=2820811 RepID=A0A940S4U0_9PROT|nr:ABC transporter permease [Pararoseomonas indoligenes]MBP0492295.1 ABC transporter permease [Pararoseomonas indoligenes]
MARRLLSLVPGLAFIALLLAGLEWAVDAGLVRRALMPPPSAIWAVLQDLGTSGEVLGPLFATLRLVFIGFALGSAVGIALGTAMGWWSAAFRLLEPLVEMMRPIPKAALVPPLMLFLGLGDTMKITSVALAVTFPVLVNTLQGVRGVDRVLLDSARTHGWGTGRTLRHVVLPASLPFILAGMRTSLGLALILAVLAEMLTGQGGLGFLILDMQRSFLIRQMYAWLVILALVGLALNALFGWAESRALHWQQRN